MMYIPKNDEDATKEIAEKLKEAPKERRDYIAGVLDGLKRADEIAAEKTNATEKTKAA